MTQQAVAWLSIGIASLIGARSRPKDKPWRRLFTSDLATAFAVLALR